MVLRLQIENVSTLPDGGPLGITVNGRRGIDIGRDQHLDWSLPDSSRFISGKHCEVRFHDDGYWLHDVSSNGTFLNGSDEAMRAPHRLKTGDRVEIGPYIVAVEVEGEGAAEAPAGREKPGRASGGNLWDVEDDKIAPPLPEEKRLRSPALPRSDGFLDQRMGGVGTGDDAYWGAQDRPASPEPVPVWAAEPEPAPRARARSIWGEDEGEPQEPVAVSPPPAPSMPEPPPVPAPKPVQPPAPPPPPVRAAPEPSPEPAAASAPPHGGERDAFVAALARGAQVPVSLFAGYPPEALGDLLGQMLRLSADSLKQMLASRSELKDLVRTSRTLVATTDNNPLKLAPTVEEALAKMFAPAAQGYLDAHATFQQSFRDLKHHQVQTFAAMQGAVGMLAKDFEPRSVEAQVEPDRGIGAMVGSRKARLWDAYVARWNAKVERHEDGLLGAFLDYFSDCYDRTGGKRP